MRDLRMIGIKMSHVLLPRGSVKELRDWDLWGPLILCLLLSITLCLTAAEDQSALVFASVFVLVWCGAGLVTINALLLGGNMCALGVAHSIHIFVSFRFARFVFQEAHIDRKLHHSCLGTRSSFFQSVSLLGYCICPLNIASIICRLTSNKIAQSIIVAVAFVWACRGMARGIYFRSFSISV